MNIVLAMAGKGSRFVDMGYKLPKPLINVCGKPMIERVVDNILDNITSFEYPTINFLCLENFINQHGQILKDIMSKNKWAKYKIISVKQVTQGAACTVLLAKELINNDQELVVTDCDHLDLSDNWLINGITYFRKNAADGGIFCFWNDNPKWSYLRINNNEVKEVVEKQVVSTTANTGTYYFKHGKDFVNAAENMIKYNIKINEEFYLAPSYNQMIIDGKKVLPYFTNEFIGLGTPADLEKYLKSCNCTI